MHLPIGEAAKQSGCAVSAIRYYEQIGLMDSALRSAGGRRHYAPADISRLLFIRRARDFGLSLNQIRDLLHASDAPPEACALARSIVAARLEEVRAKRAELMALENQLDAMIARCDALCGAEGCSILTDVANPDFRMPHRRIF